MVTHKVFWSVVVLAVGVFSFSWKVNGGNDITTEEYEVTFGDDELMFIDAWTEDHPKDSSRYLLSVLLRVPAAYGPDDIMLEIDDTQKTLTMRGASLYREVEGGGIFEMSDIVMSKTSNDDLYPVAHYVSDLSSKIEGYVAVPVLGPDDQTAIPQRGSSPHSARIHTMIRAMVTQFDANGLTNEQKLFKINAMYDQLGALRPRYQSDDPDQQERLQSTIDYTRDSLLLYRQHMDGNRHQFFQ